MHRTVVINVVGLTERLIGAHTPNLQRFLAGGKLAHIQPVIPAVTCSVQSTYLTGRWPGEHGIVGNGWYFRDECEIKFWRQSNHLVHGEKIWETARKLDPTFTCANLFWWFNMYSSADICVTPRPMYPADGRKIPDIWTRPAELRQELQQVLGQFPLFNFWGPATSIASSRWIAAAARIVSARDPTLSLIYLPHLDYVLQRVGPQLNHPDVQTDLREVDVICGELIDHARSRGARVIVLSEYGIAAVDRPVHLNRVLRENGLLGIRDEMGLEILDAGASAAFAVADHQVAHVYVNDASKLSQVRQLLEKTPGVARVYSIDERKVIHLDHPRSGELIVVAEPTAWFTYYYWLNDARAPDFARTVDIHRKPGYDPAELLFDPKLGLPKLNIALTLARRKLGSRALMKVIGLDASLIKGSHGWGPSAPADGPLVISDTIRQIPDEPAAATDIFGIILRHLTT